MGKKRIIVEVHESDYKSLADEARASGLTLANYVRRALDLPLERQGVKGRLSTPTPKKRAAGKKQKPSGAARGVGQ